MRKLLFTISLITAVLTVTAQPTSLQFNEYGEVKTKLITGSVSHTWAINPLQAYKDTLIKYLGEGMYYEVLNHSSLNNWPEGTNTVKEYFNVQQQFTGYNLYYMYEWSDYVILRVPYKQNTHMPANLQSADKTDFYLLASYRDIENSSAAYKARKNKPASYPESLYERNYEKTTPAAESNYSKGRELHNKRQYTEALAFYKLAYEKDSSAIAAYNIGAMYYNKELTIQKVTVPTMY